MAEWGEVIDITEIRRPDLKGEIVNFYRYRVRSQGGVTFTITVPEEQTTPAVIEPILREKAKLLDKTKAL